MAKNQAIPDSPNEGESILVEARHPAAAQPVRCSAGGVLWPSVAFCPPGYCTDASGGYHDIDLNMIRAVVGGHPRDWPWCGHAE
jgi:hypothetical protein